MNPSYSSSLPSKLFDNSQTVTRISYANQSNYGEVGNETLEQNKLIYKFKVILVGDISVGKTSLLSQFMESKYSSDYKSTIGVECKSKTLPIDHSTFASLNIWDTCGNEKFRTITRQYYREAKGIVLVFDLTDRKSFDQLDIWLEDISNYAPSKISILLVGNKSDLTLKRTVSFSEANEFALNNNFPYLEVSSKNGNNVSLVFDRLANTLVRKIRDKISHDKTEKKKKQNNNQPTTTLLNIKTEKSTKCC